MGELLLCSQEIASVPYYIETISLHVYSLEELCYYLKHNIDLVEPSFMEEELCDWIRHELKMPALAEQLLKLMQEGKGLVEFIITLVGGCSYCTREEILAMQHALEAFENKSEVECRKIRADRLLEKKKYAASIQEYGRLLSCPDVTGLLEGNIWHNLGTAYAGLFSFENAADCYEKAYEKNQNPASKVQQAQALQLAQGKNISSGEEWGQVSEDRGNLLEEWTKEYLRSCR